jgi:hypothetical protein
MLDIAGNDGMLQTEAPPSCHLSTTTTIHLRRPESAWPQQAYQVLER